MFDFPNSPTSGQIVSGPNNAQWQWDGTKWIASASNQPLVVISDTPPSVVPGSLWWDSLGGNLYVRYNDPNSTAWVTATNLTGLGNAATKQDVAGALNNVGRNFIHNSQFNINQRGAGAVSATNTYPADRWILYTNLDTGVTAQRVSITDAIRSATNDESLTTFMSVAFTGNSGAAAYTELFHRIEDAHRLAGKTVILSFYAWSNPALLLGLSGGNAYGTGGSPSNPDTISPTITPVQLSPSVTRYSRTFTMPTGVGRTYGTNGDSNSFFQFWCSAGATNAPPGMVVQSGTINITGIQLEVAQPGQTTPTPLEKIDPADDLRRCQRFYAQVPFQLGGYGGGGPFGPVGQIASFPVPMRAIPSVIVSNPSYANASALQTNAIWATGWNGACTVTGAGQFIATATLLCSADL